MSGPVGPLEIMALPFAECLVLVGIHSYLGLHVLRRQVIFVDLALAQIAALGTTIAFLFSIDPLSKGAYIFSLLATVIGAALFSLTRFRKERIPQEAIIGLVYALAAAVGILIVGRAPHGAEHIKEILTGQLLWVKGEEVAAAAVVYACVGVFHYVFRHKFNAISNDPEGAYAAGINVRLWDFLFYVSFGLVITHSVRTAGVLLVFVFLVVPAIMAIMITNRLGLQLIIGWVVGTVVSVGGLAISYAADTSTGPTVVSLYGLVLLVAGLGVWLVRAARRGRALVIAGLGLLLVAGTGGALYGLGGYFGSRPYWAREDGRSRTHVHAQHGHGSGQAHEKRGPVLEGECVGDCPIHRFLHELHPLDIESRTAQLAARSDPLFVEEILRHVDPADREMRLVVARRLCELAPGAGAGPLVELMAHSPVPLLRSEALEALRKLSGDDFGFDPWDDPASGSNATALERWRNWADGRQRLQQ